MCEHPVMDEPFLPQPECDIVCILCGLSACWECPNYVTDMIGRMNSCVSLFLWICVHVFAATPPGVAAL